jgi:hypothetical protein
MVNKKDVRRLSVGTVPRKAAGSSILTAFLLAVTVIVIAGHSLIIWCGWQACQRPYYIS